LPEPSAGAPEAQVPSKRKRRGASRAPVRRQAQIPSKRKRRVAPRERERGRDQARGRGPLAEPRAGGEARSRASGSDGIGGAERDRSVPLSLRSAGPVALRL